MKDIKQTHWVWAAKVTSKGQIAIPKQAREVFGIKDGDTVLLLGDKEKGIAIVQQKQYLDFANAIFDASKTK